ncbi:MAG TPA: ATP-dependent Clp protease ATP-binding subunit, partial [Oscillospiraceae bacterium]|nr:ATP-dependent Clp protease ATP-binding subunit [Oscillospiraceae bacterium]
MNKALCIKCKKRPAVIFVSKIEEGKATQEGYCMKCALDMNIGPIKQMMANMGITEDEVDAVSEQFTEMFDGLEGFQPGGAGTMPFLNAQMGEPVKEQELEAEEDENKKGRRKGKKLKNKRKFLSLYCTDLTAKAKDGGIDIIVGRQQEIYRVTQILCRRTKNNPCLIGEPGVGKTAIAEGLALKIAAGDVPARLSDKELHLLDLTALVAGTQFRGQFESRIKGLVEEVKSEGNIILFIDEVHNLVGTGDAEGSMNAANILKPALSRGEIQVIGATTFTEYRKHIEKDAALERRFQPVKVEEPSIADSYQMLLGIKNYYEEYHKVEISDSLVYKAVIFSERYINDRFLPDKAIDLLDEACTCANLRNKSISDYEILLKELEDLHFDEEDMISSTEEIDYEELARIRAEILKLQGEEKDLKEKAADNAVTEQDLAKVINLWTGIPTQKVMEGDIGRLTDLEMKLKSRIIGQDEAVEAVSAAIRRSRVQISPQRRPASFIFIGPTGVGKTELVKQLASELFDTPETLIRLDMSEFMEKHSVSRLIGSPPGYIGYDEAGQLTEKVRRKPYSVILFDEIEKAHPDVMNILLQILDEGKTSDAQGRTVSFESCVIIMTSNAGSENKESALGFNKSKSDATKERMMKALKEFLRPEFLGRVDEIVVFNNLELPEYEKIAEILINELKEPLKEKGITLEVGEGVAMLIAKQSDDGARGARELRRTLRKLVEDQIANIIIASANSPVEHISLTAVEDKIKVAGYKGG